MKDEIFGCVEYPKEQSEVTRGMKIQGWAFSASGQDTNIEIYVDGHYIKEIQTGIPRFDVEKSHPKFNEVAYTSGFLTKILMPEVSVYDYHTLEIRAKNKEFSKTIGVIKIKLNTKIIEEVWPDEGMTVHFRDAGIEAFAYMKKL